MPKSSPTKEAEDETYQSDMEEPEEETENPEELEDTENLEELEHEDSDSEQGSEDEEKEQEDETYNDEDLLEELYEGDENIEDDENEAGNDPPDEAIDAGAGDEDNDFEDKRKRPAAKNRKDVKRRLFPFIQKDRRLARANKREAPEYWEMDMRELVPGFLEKLGGLTSKGCGILENAVYNATARYFQLEDRIIPEDDSIEFKKTYWNILRYVVGAWSKMSKKEILEEIKTDKWGFKSKLFSKAQEMERLLEQKIKQPDEVTEDSNYPCPKCHGIRHTRLRVQDRSGDEAGSLRLWCSNTSCGYGWRITG
jgi:DNA-directed RNA polymerase subunit M/transcription elongation factor TFIIS